MTGQLKSDIDGGVLHDKLDHFDPAAVLLGTDDEAAGTPAAAATAARERQRQGAIAGRGGLPDRRGARPHRANAMSGGTFIATVAAIGAAAVAAVLLLYWL